MGLWAKCVRELRIYCCMYAHNLGAVLLCPASLYTVDTLNRIGACRGRRAAKKKQRA